MNNQQKQQVLDQINKANNVLVTVSNSPTVDELAASIGLTLLLNKMDKHATTVFSGVVPSTIEFLQPEKTIETTTDSLRDFIIALDKSKADKLRYKVENDVVRIFITPYKTSITQNDLEYSQGDFNVDLVLALGVTKQTDLDTAITAHGRILHDAVVSVLTNRDTPTELGTVNWQELQASSLCEMVAILSFELKPEMIDGQMATSLLTGIIAETDRFKNEKTSPVSLQLSSQLMSSGANQQLIAEKLDESINVPVHNPLNYPVQAHTPSNPVQPIAHKVVNNGELDIDHDQMQQDENGVDKIHIDEHGNLQPEPGDELMSPNNFNLPAQQVTSDFSEAQSSDELSQDNAQDNLVRENDVYQESTDINELPQAEDNSAEEQKPTLSHSNNVINPILAPGEPVKSDKPFDLQAAMQSMNSDYIESPIETPQETVESDHAQPLEGRPFEQVDSPVEAAVAEPQYQPAVEMPPVMPAEPVMPVEPVAPIVDTVPEPVVPVESHESTLADLEKSVGSPHAEESAQAELNDLEQLRNSVASAASAMPPQFPTPNEAIGAQPLEINPVVETPQPEQSDNSAPEVPPPLTPMFYDPDGQNVNPFLNPDKH